MEVLRPRMVSFRQINSKCCPVDTSILATGSPTLPRVQTNLHQSPGTVRTCERAGPRSCSLGSLLTTPESISHLNRAERQRPGAFFARNQCVDEVDDMRFTSSQNPCSARFDSDTFLPRNHLAFRITGRSNFTTTGNASYTTQSGINKKNKTRRRAPLSLPLYFHLSPQASPSMTLLSTDLIFLIYDLAQRRQLLLLPCHSTDTRQAGSEPSSPPSRSTWR